MDIMHDKQRCRFSLEKDGLLARVDYVTDGKILDIRHTFVPVELRGNGLASQLVKAAYDYAQEQRLKPVATCSYAVAWLERHPEYNGETGCDYGGAGTCAL